METNLLWHLLAYQLLTAANYYQKAVNVIYGCVSHPHTNISVQHLWHAQLGNENEVQVLIGINDCYRVLNVGEGYIARTVGGMHQWCYILGRGLSLVSLRMLHKHNSWLENLSLGSTHLEHYKLPLVTSWWDLCSHWRCLCMMSHPQIVSVLNHILHVCMWVCAGRDSCMTFTYSRLEKGRQKRKWLFVWVSSFVISCKLNSG